MNLLSVNLSKKWNGMFVKDLNMDKITKAWQKKTQDYENKSRYPLFGYFFIWITQTFDNSKKIKWQKLGKITMLKVLQFKSS